MMSIDKSKIGEIVKTYLIKDVPGIVSSGRYPEYCEAMAEVAVRAGYTYENLWDDNTGEPTELFQTIDDVLFNTSDGMGLSDIWD